MKNFREFLFESGFDIKGLKKRRKALSKEERDKVMAADACWESDEPNGEKTPGIWKTTDSKGNICYCSNTHRAISIKGTLSDAIKAFKFIKSTG